MLGDFTKLMYVKKKKLKSLITLKHVEYVHMNILSGEKKAVYCVTDPRSLHLIQRKRAITEGVRHREE